ncbi:MAG: hypothetical protein M1821_005761 [Bathelium mastoideum]|nr:MAG: hypothetical protein M1821_005761 [Bathelium mastoideum]
MIGGWGYYSPGLACPQGFTTACSAIGSNGTVTTAGNQAQRFSFQYPLDPLETAAGCCPSGYNCFMLLGSGVEYQTCLSMVLDGSLTTNRCLQSTLSGPVEDVTLKFDVPVTETIVVDPSGFSSINRRTIMTSNGETVATGVTTTTGAVPISFFEPSESTESVVSLVTIPPNTIIDTYTTTSPVISLFAPLIQLNWQASDLPITTPSKSSALTTTIPSTRADASTSGSSFSTHAKIAISVVVPVILVVVALLITGLLIRRRRQKRHGRASGEAYSKPELEAKQAKGDIHGLRLPAELSSTEGLQELGPEERHELNVPRVHHELVVPHVIHEIGSSEAGA